MTELARRAMALWPVTPDGVVLFIAATLLTLAAVDPASVWPVVTKMTAALLHTAPFILFAILTVAYMKASGAEHLVATAFKGRESRMIVLAAAMGALVPFCSCEIIPFIAGLLALGAPLSAVMALWLASPLMDPAMFAITAGAIGVEFALAKTVSAIAIGLAGGFLVKAFARTPVFVDPLRASRTARGAGCGTTCCGTARDQRQVWRFWRDGERRAEFADTARTNAWFLLKWLSLAYLLEALMLRYVPAEWIAGALGSNGPGTVVLAALVGAPAYLNGYAAVPLIGGLIDQGMGQGAAMAFVIAGGVSSIPAAVAVWALVKPRVFAAYLALGVSGAIIAGLVWGAAA